MKYRTLLFDVDNTLLDFDANEQESFRHMLQDLGEKYQDELYEVYHALNKEGWKQIERGEMTTKEWLPKRFAVLMKRYGKEIDGALWEDVFRSYLSRGIQMMPHAHEVLQTLQDRYRLYVITNGVEETQLYRMRESGLDRYFQELFISHRIGASKPSKEFFDYVKQHIPRWEARETLVIGDSLTSDIQGGQNAGLDTCWINRSVGVELDGITPTYVIHELTELLQILE